MFDNTPDAFSNSVQNSTRINAIEQELNAYFFTNPINKLLKLVKDMNTQINVLQYQIKELKGIINNENSNN